MATASDVLLFASRPQSNADEAVRLITRSADNGKAGLASIQLDVIGDD